METIMNSIASSQFNDRQILQKDILFVDNDLASYFLVMELLSEHGINVIHSRCGKHAISTFRETPSICVVLTELLLPNIDGFGVLKEIRRLNPYLPVVAQTANVMNNMKHTCLEAGFDEFIEKPINIELFTKEITKYLKKSYFEDSVNEYSG
jgi:CheY-like chemotaxis protein